MSDISETSPMYFEGAAQSGGTPAIIYISSDEDERMDSFDGDSVDDLCVSSDKESIDIEFTARSIERQMVEPIAIPNAKTSGVQAMCGTPWPNWPPFPAFTQQFFNLGVGNGPIKRDDRIKSNHPTSVCKDLRPHIGTPMSLPPEDRGPTCASCSYSIDNVSVESIASHVDDLALSGDSGLAGCSDCEICGKSVQQIQSEAVNDYLDKTVVPGEKKVSIFGRNVLRNIFAPVRGNVAGGRLRWQLVYDHLRLLQSFTRNDPH